MARPIASTDRIIKKMFTCAQNCLYYNKLGCHGSQGSYNSSNTKRTHMLCTRSQEIQRITINKPKAKSSMQQLVKFITEAYKNPVSWAVLCQPFLLLTPLSPQIQLSSSTHLVSSMAKRNSKAYYAFGLFILVMLMQRADATEFRVGGTNGWTVPTDPKALSFNQWAEMNRFHIGDTLCKLITLYGPVLASLDIVCSFICISIFLLVGGIGCNIGWANFHQHKKGWDHGTPMGVDVLLWNWSSVSWIHSNSVYTIGIWGGVGFIRLLADLKVGPALKILIMIL